uniref:EGF-like domain-containing protein n=1 Tax=Panagrolaimus sp. ES5 TaxID=591445 RepID=A0AC34GVD5_9BILA
MKRLLLLTFLTFLVTAINAAKKEGRFGKSDRFHSAIQESLETEHSVWLRNHHASKSGNPIKPGIKFLAHHNIPSDIPLIPPPGQLVATNQFGVKCDQGYTGDFCNIPVCNGMANISTHFVASEGEAIELATSYECNDMITFPIDNYALDVAITVYSANGGMPSANLTMLNGTVISPDEIVNPGGDFRYYTALFYGLSEFTGAGYYNLQLSSETIAPCSYQITTLTRAVYDTGFVQSVNDDFIQKDIYRPWRVLKEPIQNTANYLGAKLSGVLQPAKPEVVTFFNGDDKQYAPMTLGIRYQCNSPYVSPMYTCVRTDFYKAKFVGYDHKGNVFQRLYMFTCGETNPSEPPPSPTPVVIPDTCYNGGTMITYGQNNRTCLCGMYYTGNQCETPLCFNGGVLQDGVCVCFSGYSGRHCSDIYCKSQAQENFDTHRRALVFVVRTTSSFAPYINSSVARTASQIVGYTEYHSPGYFRRYVLVGYANDAISFIGEFDDSVQFQNAIANLPVSQSTNNCSDSLYAALSAAVTSESVRLFQRSPIFSFGDNLPDDPQNRAALYESLGYYQGQIFTILTDAAQSNCNIDTHNLEYRELRRLAQFTHGLVPYLPVNNLTDTAFNIATGVEGMASLATNDFVDQCSLGTKYTTFFVDDATGLVTVLATGDNLNITVMSVDGTTLTPSSYHNVGNTHVYSFNTLLKGNYLLQISADQNSPCQFRVYGSSKYEMFVGTSDGLTTDISRKQPRPFQVTNIVARLNEVVFRNPGEIFAEVVVWTNDIRTGQRHVLYAANGNYRDSCDYHFIFEEFICTERDSIFYISLYVTDRVGYTIQRVRAGICAVPSTVPTTQQGCQNGGVVDPTNPNGTCICPNGWSGDKCQTIKCQNGGTSRFSFCECRAGFTGEFCEIIACNSETYEDFSPNRRSLTFVVHDSTTTIQMIQKMQTQMAQVIQDITQQHPRWITQFSLLVFNNVSVSQPIETNDPALFLQGFNNFAAANAFNTTVRSCDNLPLLEVLYIHLATSDAYKYGIYYVFMNGIMGLSSGNLFDQVQGLLETTQSQINIVQTNSYPCGHPITDLGPSRMWLLTTLTGGQVYVISSATTEKVMKTIPFQYRNSLSYERYYDDCSAGQNFYFPVDSESQTVSILIDGELSGDPQYIHPDGSNDTYMVTNIFNDYSANTRLDQIIAQCDNSWRQASFYYLLDNF